MNRKRLAAALAYVDEKAKRLTSLDQPQSTDAADVALDIAAGFTPLQYPREWFRLLAAFREP